MSTSHRGRRFAPRRRRSRLSPLGDADSGRIVKKAARNAAMKEWRVVHPHALRKSFEEGVKRRRPDGTMMGEKDQEFLMGHILSGSQDPHYGSGISVEGSTICLEIRINPTC